MSPPPTAAALTAHLLKCKKACGAHLGMGQGYFPPHLPMYGDEGLDDDPNHLINI